MSVFKVDLSHEMVEEISMVLPKLKHSVTLDRVVSWLSMFEPEDQKYALEMLFFMEYLSCEEMQMRFDQLLTRIFILLKSDRYKILILPIGDDGKSGDLMKYFLKRTRVFQKKKSRITLGKDFFNKPVTKNSVLVLLDDFIGSGKSVIEHAKKIKLEQWIDSNPKIKEKYVLTLLSLEDGKQHVEQELNGFKVISENRLKAFDGKTSSFRLKYKVHVIKEIALKYGNRLPTDSEKTLWPYGYENSEGLVAFPTGSPNNTLPIMWCTSNGWKAIYPRYTAARMDSARKLKKDIAYWIGIMHRLNIVIDEDKTVYVDGKRRKYASKKYHSLLTYLRLRKDSYEKPVICQIIGITTEELNTIISQGVIKKYLDTDGNLTNLGSEYYQKLTTSIKANKMNKLVYNNLQIMAAEEYIEKKNPGKNGKG